MLTNEIIVYAKRSDYSFIAQLPPPSNYLVKKFNVFKASYPLVYKITKIALIVFALIVTIVSAVLFPYVVLPILAGASLIVLIVLGIFKYRSNQTRKKKDFQDKINRIKEEELRKNYFTPDQKVYFIQSISKMLENQKEECITKTDEIKFKLDVLRQQLRELTTNCHEKMKIKNKSKEKMKFVDEILDSIHKLDAEISVVSEEYTRLITLKSQFATAISYYSCPKFIERIKSVCKLMNKPARYMQIDDFLKSVKEWTLTNHPDKNQNSIFDPALIGQVTKKVKKIKQLTNFKDPYYLTFIEEEWNKNFKNILQKSRTTFY